MVKLMTPGANKAPAPTTQTAPATATAPAQAPAAETARPSSGKAGFMMTGKRAAQARTQAQAAASAGRGNRFFLKKPAANETVAAEVLFVDGTIDPETGMFVNPMWYEHLQKVGDQMMEIICTSHEGPCPICEHGTGWGKRASLVTGFTIIDLRQFERDGKVVPFSRRLYPAVPKVERTLLEYAKERDGSLAGWRVKVKRTGEKDPRVGGTFDFLAKMDHAEMVQRFGDAATPLDYTSSDVLNYLSAEEIKSKLGIGAGIAHTAGDDAAADDDMASHVF